jgi:iron complex outermembrane receptor protein
VYLEADWRFLPHWHLNTSLKSVLDRERAAGDPRPKIDDFALVNVTLRRLNIGHHLDLSFSVRNLLDADAREPSRSFQTLPGDLPLAGRNVYAEIIYHF